MTWRGVAQTGRVVGVHTALENQAADSSPRALLHGGLASAAVTVHTGVLPACHTVGGLRDGTERASVSKRTVLFSGAFLFLLLRCLCKGI